MKNMNYNDFWESCVEADCVVAPIKLYKKWNEEGNLNDQDLIGTKYVAFLIDNQSVETDFYIDVEQATGDIKRVFDTPEEALWDFMNRTALFQKRLAVLEDILTDQESLGKDFEKVWDDNVAKLYER